VFIIFQNVNIEVLNDYDIKFREFDRKRTSEGQLNDLLTDLKYLDIKIIDNIKLSSIFNGYGEGICLVITQLLDKYLVNQNFIFKKPNIDTKNKNQQSDFFFEEPIIHDYFPNGPNGGNGNNTVNKTKCFSLNSLGNSNTKDEIGKYKKIITKFKNIIETNLESKLVNRKSLLIIENSDDNGDRNILEANIDVKDWMDEYNRVKKHLENFNSQSLDEKDLQINLNDIFDQKNRLIILSGLSNYFCRSSATKSFDEINKLSLEVDRSLKKISIFEKRISLNAEKKVYNTVK